MDRTARLLSMFDASGLGLEVGPSYNPLLPKSAGYNVEIFDHADAETLRAKYRDNASQIEEVDYVSDGRGLLDVIGKPGRYDYIVASHVIEHVADIVRFIQDCETLLKDGGTLVLAVPDKRYCFDTLRPISTVGQALQAFAEKRTRHSPGVVFDHLSMICTKERWGVVWREPALDDLKLQHDPALARDFFEAALSSPDYLDVHGWQFTPTSFEYLIKTLRSQDYIKSGVQSTAPGDPVMHEFYVVLSKTAPVCTTPDIDMLKQTAAELRDIEISRGVEAAKPAPLNETIDQLRSEIARVEANYAAVKASTSWKITAPIRYVRSLFS